MHIERAVPHTETGWNIGPWDTSVSISVGFVDESLNDPHFHEEVTEIYMVAQGTVDLRVEQETVRLHQNDVVVIEPGEAHTFLAASPDYFHFVVRMPGVADTSSEKDRVRVKRSRLGL